MLPIRCGNVPTLPTLSLEIRTYQKRSAPAVLDQEVLLNMPMTVAFLGIFLEKGSLPFVVIRTILAFISRSVNPVVRNRDHVVAVSRLIHLESK
jgi:hypothetical protein